MKIKVSFEVDDFLEQVETEDGEVYYDFKNCEQVKNEIRNDVVRKVVWNIRQELKYSHGEIQSIRDEILEQCKDEIIESVIKKVSTSIINSKKIKDFKKSLDEE